MPDLGLRGRFILANFAVIFVLVAVPAVLSSRLFETYETGVMFGQVERDLERLQVFLTQSPAIEDIRFGDSRGLIVSADRIASLPPQLANLPPGVHEDIRMGSHEYFVGRRDTGGVRLYVLLDAQPFEDMERSLFNYAALSLLAGLFVALLASVWMSRQVLRPVTELSAWLARIEPGKQHEPFAGKYGDADIDGMAATFERYLERLEEFVAREQALTEDISHELRTPITVARSAVTLLLESPDLPATARQRIERIARATRQMEELVEAILFLAREDGGGSDGLLSLGDVVGEAVESRQEAAARAGAHIHLVLTQPQTVVAHRGMVMSIIGNVLDNAIRHGGAGEIRVCLQPGRLTVSDQGPGISAEHIDAVFSRRTRGAGSRGYGLGLHIVRSLCERLGWSIALRPADGGGTQATLAFTAAGNTPRDA